MLFKIQLQGFHDPIGQVDHRGKRKQLIEIRAWLFDDQNDINIEVMLKNGNEVYREDSQRAKAAGVGGFGLT